MKYPWIDEYLRSKPGVFRDHQMEWNWIRCQIGGKMFAAILLDDHNLPYYINLKLEPWEGELMRQQYTDIIPGYYSNKQHWNSILADGNVPDDLLRHLLDRSYRLVLESFSKTKQREILGIACCGLNCASCSFHGQICAGCNQERGKVFHANGQTCPIYACCVGKHHFLSCGSCGSVPCEIWMSTRDPSLSDSQFQESVNGRLKQIGCVS